jgi:preprotein translocase subunit SecE
MALPQTEDSVVFQKMITYYREIVTELGKVSWPTRDQLRVSTTVVLVVTAIFAVFIGSFDWVLSQVVQWFLR